MNYRKAIPEDLENLSVLFNMYRIFYRKESDLEGAKQFLNERLKRQDSEIHVAETKDQHLSGFVQLYPLFSSTRMKKLWLLNDLFVHPDFRSQGISISLIDRAKKLVVDSKACGMFLDDDGRYDVKVNLIFGVAETDLGF